MTRPLGSRFLVHSLAPEHVQKLERGEIMDRVAVLEISGVEIGRHLGLSESRGRAMMREQLATNASDSGPNSQYLVPPTCRNGGAADLRPSVSAFP